MKTLNLEDLQPVEASLVLSEKPGKTYTLKKFSLSARIWIRKEFPEDKIKEIFENRSIPEIAKIAHYLLKDKSDFQTFEDFTDAVVTTKDQVALVRALLSVIGIDDEMIKSLSEDKAAKDKSDPNG